MLVEIHNNEILFSKKSGYKTGEVFDFIDYARKTRYPDRRLAQFHNLEIKNFVSGLCDGGAIEAQIFNFAKMFNR